MLLAHGADLRSADTDTNPVGPYHETDTPWSARRRQLRLGTEPPLATAVRAHQPDMIAVLLRYGAPVATATITWALYLPPTPACAAAPRPLGRHRHRVTLPLVYYAAWRGSLALVELLAPYTTPWDFPETTAMAASHEEAEEDGVIPYCCLTTRRFVQCLLHRKVASCLLHLWASRLLPAPRPSAGTAAGTSSFDALVYRCQWPAVRRLWHDRYTRRRGMVCYHLLGTGWPVAVVDLLLDYDVMGVCATIGSRWRTVLPPDPVPGGDRGPPHHDTATAPPPHHGKRKTTTKRKTLGVSRGRRVVRSGRSGGTWVSSNLSGKSVLR